MNFVWFQYRSIHGNVNAWVGVITLKKKKNLILSGAYPKELSPGSFSRTKWFRIPARSSSKYPLSGYHSRSCVRILADIVGAHLTKGEVLPCSVRCNGARMAKSAAVSVRRSVQLPPQLFLPVVAAPLQCPGGSLVPGFRRRLTSG